MAQRFADVLGAFRVPEKVVPLVADGALLAEREEAAAALDVAVASPGAATDPAVAELAARVRDLEQRCREATVAFRLRGLGRNAFRRLLAEHRKDDGSDDFDPVTFPQALISACALDPVMAPADVQRLCDVLNDGQVDALFGAAWEACREAVDSIRPSVPASLLTQG